MVGDLGGPYPCAMVALVFDDPKVSRTTPLAATESRVNWFLKSTRPQASEARRIVNDMYARFPDPSGRFRSRLRSRDEATHRSALDELLVHDLLRCTYRVEHEDVGATGTHPDFALFDGEEHVATVEVYSLMLRKEWQDEQGRHGRIEDALNHRLRPTTHFIDFEVKAGPRTPTSSISSAGSLTSLTNCGRTRRPLRCPRRCTTTARRGSSSTSRRRPLSTFRTTPTGSPWADR